MNTAYKHFGRTLEFGRIAGLDFREFFTEQATILKSDLDRVSKKIKRRIDGSKSVHLKKLKEIYAIEKEKLALRDSKKVTDTIFRKELSYNIEREKLLSLNFPELQDTMLVLNALATTYESDWKWCERDPFQAVFDFKKILGTEKDDHYFLLEKTGTFDGLLDTNVSEFPLTEYQYFLLQLFEKPTKVKDVLMEFFKVFEVANSEEAKELSVLTEHLIRDFIFRRFIVLAVHTEGRLF